MVDREERNKHLFKEFKSLLKKDYDILWKSYKEDCES